AVDEAKRRVACLPDVGGVVGGSLDREVTARDAVRLALALADTGALVIPARDARDERVVVGRAAPDEPVVEQTSRAALDPVLDAAIGRAVALGGPAGGPETVLAVPLRARGDSFAALVLARR